MLLMFEKGVTSEISRSINRHVKANNKCIKDYYKNKESSHLKYWSVSN